MKRPLNNRYPVAALALLAIFGIAGCPQEGKEETKAAPPAVAPVQPTPAATADPAAAPAVPTAAVPAAAGEGAKPEPSKPAAAAETK